MRNMAYPDELVTYDPTGPIGAQSMIRFIGPCAASGDSLCPANYATLLLRQLEMRVRALRGWLATSPRPPVRHDNLGLQNYGGSGGFDPKTPVPYSIVSTS